MSDSGANLPRPAALKVKALAKTFKGAAAAVWSDVSFMVEDGESVAIIGGNGTGKSTLLRCCLGLIESDAGSVHLHGQALTTAKQGNLRSLRASVGFVFQKHNLVPRLSVLTNVMHGGMARRRSPRMWHHAIARSEDREYAMHCLESVGLADLATRRADQLSGGQSQRVAIARALMQQPKMIFADEPVASLDPQAGEDVMEAFTDLVRDKGLTLVFVSHHLDHAIRYADRILALRAGRLDLDTPANTETVARLRTLYV